MFSQKHKTMAYNGCIFKGDVPVCYPKQVEQFRLNTENFWKWYSDDNQINYYKFNNCFVKSSTCEEYETAKSNPKSSTPMMIKTYTV
jgi:hypothetical protein